MELSVKDVKIIHLHLHQVNKIKIIERGLPHNENFCRILMENFF